MIRAVSKGEGLPEWFDKSKYDGVRDFGASEWLACLRIRKNVLDGLSTLMEALSTNDTVLCFSYARETMPELIQELEVLRSSPLEMTGCASWGNVSGNFHEKHMSRPIRPVMMSDIARVYSTDRFRVENGYTSEQELDRWGAILNWPTIPANAYEVPLDIKLEPPHDLKQEASHDTDTRPHATLYVDLRATDAVLRKAFDLWLKEARSEERQRINYTRWRVYGLLPYLDLYIWERATDNRLTRSLMTEAVGYRSGPHNFKEIVIPLAADLMRGLGELEAIAGV